MLSVEVTATFPIPNKPLIFSNIWILLSPLNITKLIITIIITYICTYNDIDVVKQIFYKKDNQ